MINVLGRETLDPTFEDYGDFIDPKPEWLHGNPYPDNPGMVSFFGNFKTVSHGFNIRSDEPDIVHRLSAAILANKATETYKKARADLVKYRKPSRAKGGA